jgi:hypothetical protein
MHSFGTITNTNAITNTNTSAITDTNTSAVTDTNTIGLLDLFTMCIPFLIKVRGGVLTNLLYFLNLQHAGEYTDTALKIGVL